MIPDPRRFCSGNFPTEPECHPHQASFLVFLVLPQLDRIDFAVLVVPVSVVILLFSQVCSCGPPSLPASTTNTLYLLSLSELVLESVLNSLLII